ncbi:MAG: hypothetical protein K2M68_04345 [Muribaculaceae bacterium]|nr:hypothetical protein [Muribaculaceae bacterium]
MKRVLKHISSAVAVVALGVSMTACDDWTEPKSIDINYGTIESADPAAYAKYLANLRAYRNKPHKKVYAWFNNNDKAISSQGERITALPDSIDVVVLTAPASITNQMVQEISKVQTEKGMKVLIDVTYNDIKSEYQTLCEELANKRLEFGNNPANEGVDIPAELLDPSLAEFCADAFTKRLAYISLGVDGLMTGFDGKSTLHLTPAEIEAYYAEANTYLGVVTDFHERNKGVMMDFAGRPQNITDYPILADFNMLFISDAVEATDSYMYTRYYSLVKDVVDDSKLGLMANYRAIDTAEDSKTGFFADGSLALDGLAKWTASHNVGAAGIMNVQNDYYVSNGTYEAIRRFIQEINPAAK